MGTITVNCLSDYIDQVSTLNKKRNISWFSEDSLLYRGQSNAAWELSPSLSRVARADSSNQFTLLEQEIIQQAQCLYPSVFSDSKYPFGLLSMLQHYGVPTRLLDISRNALIALYFACQDSSVDGEVIVFLTSEIYTGFDPIANAIADTYRILGEKVEMTAEMYFSIAATQEYYSFYEAQDRQTYGLYCNNDYLKKFPFQHSFAAVTPRFVLPQYASERQVRQHSLFLIFPNEIIPCDGGENGLGNRILPIAKTSEIVTQLITIPKEVKEDILKDLYSVGVYSGFLFPDNIERGCRELAQRFRDRIATEKKDAHNVVG